jgi:acyl-CoA reductase-like NAD-dependent aldehyde dehydrogenase
VRRRWPGSSAPAACYWPPRVGYQLEPHAAFGGYRQSGLGREGGRPAIESYTELKTVMLPFTDEMM